ncbi:MAG: hypothetical protein EON54_16600 [Alcaligenaceae bacterium]|nr:MAG: hypothetical protein EON54_16600 [Alcaligenaceae bacterium]
MRFQNPANGHIEEFGEATWLWVLVGGPIYFAYKQMWLQAALSAVLAPITGFMSWVLLYPLAIKWILRTQYAKLGWKEIKEGAVSVSSPTGARSIDVQILTEPPQGNYRPLSEVTVKLTRWSPLERKYTREDVEQRLREKAMALGGNAVINVRYEQRDHTMATAGYIEGRGLAIIDESDTAPCPLCAEPIKREAVRCKHCGSDIQK